MAAVSIRAGGVGIDVSTREHIRSRMTRKLGAFSSRIERSRVHIANVRGPRASVDMACNIEVVLAELPSVKVQERGATPREAFDRAATAAARAVRQSLGRTGTTERWQAQADDAPELAGSAAEPNPPPEDGSYIGGRVGHGDDELARAQARPEKLRRNTLVDTAQPGVSASSRKAGGGSTARRNTRKNEAGMTAALEDSAQDRPSRKSTRRSTGRVKRDSNLARRQTRKVSAPKERARRSARGGKRV